MFLFLCPAFTHAQQPRPPFSDIYIKPPISPYLILSDNFNMPYQMSVIPLMQQQKQQRELYRQKEKINNLQNQTEIPPPRGQIIYSPQIRPTGHNCHHQGIRPTGHHSGFGNTSHYYQGLP
jgi:hypothetical protein